MSGGYILCEYQKVRDYAPEYKGIMEKLEQQLVAHAEAKWAPLKAGANALGVPGKGTMYPKSGEFGKGTIMPELFQGPAYDTGVLTTLNTWKTFISSTTQTVPGSNTLLQGSATSGMIYEDYMIGIAGIALLDKVQRISEIKMQIGDRKLPRINIEEAFAYEKPCIIFEDGFIVDEEESVHLYAYCLSQGIQTIAPIGLQVNRVPNKLQVSLPGAVLT